MAISTTKKESPSQPSVSLKKRKSQSHDLSTSVDSDVQQQSLPDSSVPFASPTLQQNTADTEEKSWQNLSTGFDSNENVFQNSFIDPLFATYSKHQPTHDLHFLDNVVLPSVHKSITGFNDDENDSDVQSSLFDDDCNSPRSTNSSVSSQGSRKPIYNNYSQYPFGLDSDMENEVLDYDRVCHLSTASMKNDDGLASDGSFPYTQYLESKSNQFIKHAFGQPNPMSVNNADYWDLNASNNDHTIDGITMLDSTFTSALRPEWNFNSATSHTNDNDNDNKNRVAGSFGRLINKNLESLFETKKHKDEKSLQSRAELSDTLKCQNYFNLYSVPGSNKVFSNALENASVDPKSAATKLSKPTDLFSVHLSQYGSSSNGKDLFPGFDYSHVLPNSKSTNAILDFFAGANGSYNGSGNDIFDPEILKASN